MAKITKKTDNYVAKFVDEAGDTLKIEVPYPDENKTDINFVQAAEDMRTSGAFKPDGSALVKIKSVSLVSTNKTYFDLDRLNAN